MFMEKQLLLQGTLSTLPKKSNDLPGKIGNSRSVQVGDEFLPGKPYVCNVLDISRKTAGFQTVPVFGGQLHKNYGFRLFFLGNLVELCHVHVLNLHASCRFPVFILETWVVSEHLSRVNLIGFHK